ncbi:MAG: FIST C-terminal domain-containing protein [Candidatus Accumulibacter sp.]|jgi:hypothetical protein|nr:FIST C-terminal domain-containing protein [Accumulibacter sp.]
MKVGIGYSENPDSLAAGIQAATNALEQAHREPPCDLALLFSTVRHNPVSLRKAVASILGNNVPIIGGCAIGAISNTRFGYAGDQIVLAAIWLEGIGYDLIVEGNLAGQEMDAGKRLGEKLAELGIEKNSPILFFYDAVDQTQGKPQMNMATPLLEGISRTLGFLPGVIGAGLIGDYTGSPTWQWTGDGIAQNRALALALDPRVHVDSAALHGCRPGTGYYRVTKADRQTILEIDGQPALTFINGILKNAIPPEDYAFFLILGINGGRETIDETDYVNRLCIAIDRTRNGIVMSEPDMLEGTEFQIMYHSIGLDYIPGRVEELFSRLGGRKPVLALYINFASRAAVYTGIDLEDAFVIQEVVGGRVPLMGIYTGVEIAPINGTPCPLDWTGLFCLFSLSQ